MSRITYQDGSLTLIVRIIDGNGTLITPDSLPTIDIFPPGFDPRVAGVVDGDALLLAQAVTLEDTGVYTYTYTTVPDTDIGTYYDRWHWTEDGIAQEYTFEFTVLERINLQSYNPMNNQIIRVVLESTIGTSTTSETLSADYQMHFSYVMTPMYASSQLLELEAGAYIQDIPDDTLDTNILLASLEADILTFETTTGANSYFNYVRQRYTVCRALFRILGNLYSKYMKRKRLADLDVTYGDAIIDKLNQVSNCASEFELVLNSKGNLSPHTSLRPGITIPGLYDADRPAFGRGWQVGDSPGANTKDYPSVYHNRVRKSWKTNPRERKNWTTTR